MKWHGLAYELTGVWRWASNLIAVSACKHSDGGRCVHGAGKWLDHRQWVKAKTHWANIIMLWVHANAAMAITGRVNEIDKTLPVVCKLPGCQGWSCSLVAFCACKDNTGAVGCMALASGMTNKISIFCRHATAYTKWGAWLKTCKRFCRIFARHKSWLQLA